MYKYILPILLLLGGCAQDSSEVDFIDMIRQETTSSDILRTDDQVLLDVGEATCDQFARGAGFDDVAATFILNNIEPRDAGLIIAASVTHLCPEYMEDVNESVTVRY